MERGELHKAVACAIAGDLRRLKGTKVQFEAWEDTAARAAAAAAVGVVLAEARRSIEALPRFEGAGLLRSNGVWVSRREALAVLAALGEQACSWCDQVGSHAARCPNA